MSAVPITHPAVTRHQFRAQVCRLVDRLIGILDAIDGDADLEDGGDLEPSLSASIPDASWRGSQVAWLEGGNGNYDMEEAADDRGEPSLTNLQRSPLDQSGSRWIGGVTTEELEDQCEDEGAVTGDDEPEDGF